MLCSEGYLLI